MAPAAEAKTQTPIEGVDTSALDKIEKAQRTDGHGEWWCMNFGTMQSVISKEERCVLGGLGLFLFCSNVFFLWHVNWCTSCDLTGE